MHIYYVNKTHTHKKKDVQEESKSKKPLILMQIPFLIPLLLGTLVSTDVIYLYYKLTPVEFHFEVLNTFIHFKALALLKTG